MRDLVILFVHIIATLARLLGPGGIRSVVAESVLIKQQLLILNRSRHRSPSLRSSDRLVAGLCALLIRPARLIRSAIVLKPSTLLSLHQALRNRNYQLLFSPRRRRSPGPKGPSRELIEAQAKQRNPTSGSPRIAQQITLAFGIAINQRPGSKDSCQSLSAGTRFCWTILADFHWTLEGQSLEYRSVPVRISHVADSLDPGRHGPIHAPDYWIWRAGGNGRRCRTLRYVQSRHSRPPGHTQVPQL